ncbi:DEAD/DEAH box helicase [Hyphomonas johnsonii]|uniref:DEAD-box ATP-dependent RNA helicase RhpA n=1 Tax=Hyphomonas johnsonii MHS-2 TaxID=1280950 RepID=A0A059FJD4_9PROT|nr:DEAD/DEAH box helicase [Hyphomonas johnsonii]KCZ90780.1 DEAD/DEAH box helicase [Hyphomonas johnsonii MHS-2]
MTQFSELGLAEPVLKAIIAEGYTTPTPIQAQAIPALLKGQDVVGIAQTGTGKTAAFVLPLLSLLATRPSRPAPRTARVLILAPTRELAAQIADSVRTYGSHMRPSVAVVVGGVKPGPQIKVLSKGVDFLIATPGRLLDHMDTRAVSLADTTAVVLDEADQMMDLGFMPAIRKVMAAVPNKRQTLLFSATMPKPIRALANDFLREPVEISVTPQSRPVERIEQAVYMIKGNAKPDFLAELLGADDMDRAIVFTRTKHGADKVVKHLANNGLYAEAIHGNKSQNQRIRALDAFKSGKAPVLVATDIAARGIDVDGVSHVINYDMPNISESYVHRIGRTARAGKTGIAISLVGNDERAYLRDIEKLTGKAIARLDPPAGTALDLSLPEEEGPHKQQRNGGRSRPGGGGGNRRGAPSRSGGGHARSQGGQAGSGSHSGGGKKRSGKPGGHRTGNSGGGNAPAGVRSRGSWSPASS